MSDTMTGDALRVVVEGRKEYVRLQQRTLDEVDDARFRDIIRHFSGNQPCVVLLSGGELDCSRHSIAARDPFLVLKSKGNRVTLEADGQIHTLEADPLEWLDRAIGSFQPDFPLARSPFCGGALGYFAYDLKNQIEQLPQTAEDDTGLPEIFLLFPRRILVHDRKERRLHILRVWVGNEPPPADDDELTSATSADRPTSLQVGELESNFTHEGYLEAVARVREYIRSGDVYQVNMSQRFRFPLSGDPFLLWERLFDVNPAPFYAYVDAGDHQVLCTSMERFLLRRGSEIETRPIKGTRKRGETPDEDADLKRELAESPKDDAELSMIVDLLRNDLGRVCRARSIHVAEHKRLEAYQNVYHLVSIVRGELRPQVTPGELLRATFPGGSITGCPKIRAMEIIDELEPHVRHVYTGSIGYLGWHDNLDLNIAIRTATRAGDACYYSVGGGVVYDSDEEAEYQETLHKGRTLFNLIERLRNPD